MTGAEVAKQLLLSAGILTIIAGGVMFLPDDARYLRASYCFAAAVILIGYLLAAKPKAPWFRSTLWWLGAGMAIIALILSLGG